MGGCLGGGGRKKSYFSREIVSSDESDRVVGVGVGSGSGGGAEIESSLMRAVLLYLEDAKVRPVPPPPLSFFLITNCDCEFTECVSSLVVVWHKLFLLPFFVDTSTNVPSVTSKTRVVVETRQA